ncbi:MAG: hypothetical protein IJW49_02625 [Clostridia bacterium]|nr:hypothetical protein [Clostridia bacterium]
MVKVNIVFDDIFDDADIIAIPDEIFPCIEQIGQTFLDWIPTATDPDYWKVINGRRCIVAETNGFIKRLNTVHCNHSEKAYVVARNTTYNPNLKTIQF